MTEFRSALDTAAAVRRGEISPTELMDETLSRIEARNPALNAVIWIDEDDARARARAATDRLASVDTSALPPFFGVPLPVKDLSTVAGWPATYGSAGAGAEPAAESGLVVQRLEAAGFVLCGRTNSPEFGTITATENARYGITRNPWDLNRTSGGSSGGASSAVASGMFSIAHASDGGGSIRIPATCTGLVGLKAARGRVVDRTVSWEGASTQGVVTHTVADTAAALDAIAVPDPLAWWNAPPPDRPFREEVGADPGVLRVALVTDANPAFPTDPECVAAATRTAAALEAAGHHVVDAVFDPHFAEFATHFVQVVNAGLAEYDVDWDRVQGFNQTSRLAAASVDSLTYTRAISDLQRWTRKVNAHWGRDFDLLVTPTMIIQPPVAGQVLDEMNGATSGSTVLQSILFTSLFNMSGLPAISLPVHQAVDTGLPIGAQLVAGPWQESLLLRVAAQVETALPWAGRHPSV